MSYQTERYHWLKEHNICVDCGRNEAFYKRVYCVDCLEKRAERYRKHYAKNPQIKKDYIKRLKEAGLCPDCAKPIDVEGGKYCSKCRDSRKAYSRMYRKLHPRPKLTDEERKKIQSENGKRNIIKCRQHINYKLAMARRKKFINDETQLHIAKKGAVINE